MSRIDHYLRRLKQEARFRANDLKFGIGMGQNLLRNRPGRRILIYHGLAPEGSPMFNSRFIEVGDFERQLRYFKEHFHLLRLEDLFQGESDPEKLNLALTFDDGYRNNLKYALPLLEKYEVPATFFITGIRDAGEEILWPDLLDLAFYLDPSDFDLRGDLYKGEKGKGYFRANDGMALKQICKASGWDFKKEMMEEIPGRAQVLEAKQYPDHWEQMTREEIRELSNSPWVEIGSHGYYHNCLAAIDHEAAVDELRKSKAFLEDICQKEIKGLAYPDGSYTRTLVDSAEACGYTMQMAVDYLFPEDAEDDRLLDRFGINPHISFLNQINCILENRY